jgi:hypothetical protein
VKQPRPGPGFRVNINNLSNLENESGNVGAGDYGRTAFMWFALNSVVAVIMAATTFACYQLPAFKENCKSVLDDPDNCVESESGQYSVFWLVPIIISTLLFGVGFMRISLPLFSPRFIRRSLFKGTPSALINKNGMPVIKLRTTYIAWAVLALLIGQTIMITVMSATVIDKRCNPPTIAKAAEAKLANFVTRGMGGLAYGSQNNFGFNLVNIVSIFNPRYWLWITITFAIIYSLLSMTGAQQKAFKAAYKTGKETALKAGKTAIVASGKGLKAGAKAFATTPMTGIKVSQRVGALGKGGGNVVKPGSKKQRSTNYDYKQEEVAMPTVAKNTALAETEKAAQKLQSAARGRAVRARAPLQTAKTQAAAAAAFKSAGAQQAATAKRQAGAAAFAGAAGQAQAASVLQKAARRKIANRQAGERQQKIDAFSQRVRERKGKDAMTRLAQQKAQAIKAKRPPITPPSPRPSYAPPSSRGKVSVRQRAKEYNELMRMRAKSPRPASAAGAARPRARSGKPLTGPANVRLAANRSSSQRGSRPVKLTVG